MLTLYTKPGCTFCVKVKEEARFLNAPLVEKDVRDEGVLDELIALGGKRQVPYFVDDEAGVAFYGSDEIIAHLHARFK
ncbi:MAG TPA: glutathione S-transferase N-terminal domain-containing protein [Candidatus Paceibacterota bacterium]|jgi:glutaredoxin